MTLADFHPRLDDYHGIYSLWNKARHDYWNALYKGEKVRLNSDIIDYGGRILQHKGNVLVIREIHCELLILEKVDGTRFGGLYRPDVFDLVKQ